MSSSPASSHSPPFEVPSEPASTAPSSPPPPDTSEYDDSEVNFTNPSEKDQNEDEVDEETAKRYERLQFVLEKSAVYSSILKARMDQDKADLEAAARAKAAAKGKGVASKRRHATQRGKGLKRILLESSDECSDDEPSRSKRMRTENGQALRQGIEEEEPPVFEQPALITGAKLKKYQLEGLQWMVSLDQNGISGILADEMGLGKTLQTIAFAAYLREHHNTTPFLVVCPLSVMHNWMDEFQKFAPSIPVCMYHGTPAERAELRRTVMALPTQPSPKKPKLKSKGRPPAKGKTKAKAPAKSRVSSKSAPRRGGRLAKSVKKDDSDAEDDDAIALDEDAGDEVEEDVMSSFPVVITTYEMIIKDRVHLAQYNWGYIVVDEGHRLKNLDCKLMQEIKKYKSAGRMILTGTPLHNNLAELWSLLNFVLPDIFNDVDSFQEWFNLPAMQTNIGSERSSQIISALHAILKPFLLRRLKVDVEVNLPPKKEYVLYAPLSVQQREAYDRVLDGTLRSYLIGKNPAKEKKVEPIEDGPRRLRSAGGKRGRKSYAVDGDDDEYFEMLEKGEFDERGVEEKIEEQHERELERLGREHQYRSTVKQVNNMKLQNAVMQLRKVCSHPFLFDWPLDPVTHQPALNDDLVNASGKMMVLDRLLRELFRRKHKVLLFSQFTTMLDIIEDWATEFMGWSICRIDGSTSPLERREQMNKFQSGGDAPDAPHLFLLSTRAGGLGINLTAADTVIFYDQDWNPQMDAQAQDRAHRIGQTKPVLIFRLVSAHTIETKIMQRATEKRKLEALVIAKGKFKKPAAAAGRGKPETMAEMAASLLRLEGEKIDVVPNTAEGKAQVLSDEDLEMLLDRSREVFADRGKGWTSAGQAPVDGRDAAEVPEEANGKKTAFAVYEGPGDQGNDALAKMMGEEIPE
ncbi:putative SNF2 family N-terminal domain [Lyophyllum shimeji]|uniref:SNF2 family N-terminal domain n=1 Tax=Lyophyllum shimeji TaxID=47721 RepID=A0A9P3USL7_LYOSH|nr:putative SNF2 family N-terminal domain [Lyophyllum shimeji]